MNLFREHRLIAFAAGGGGEKPVEPPPRPREGDGKKPEKPESPKDMADKAKREMERRAGDARKVLGDAEKKVGSFTDKMGNMFSELTEDKRSPEDKKKAVEQGKKILQEYDPSVPYSKEITIAKLQSIGIQEPTNLADAKSGKEELRTGGGVLDRLTGSFTLFRLNMSKAFNKKGDKSERGKFLADMRSVNAENANTAVVGVQKQQPDVANPQAAPGEDLTVNLIKNDPVNDKQIAERTVSLENNLKAKKIDYTYNRESKTFVFKNGDAATLNQVKISLKTIQDNRDKPKPPPSAPATPDTPAEPEKKSRDDAQTALTNAKNIVKFLKGDNETKVKAEIKTVEDLLTNKESKKAAIDPAVKKLQDALKAAEKPEEKK